MSAAQRRACNASSGPEIVFRSGSRAAPASANTYRSDHYTDFRCGSQALHRSHVDRSGGDLSVGPWHQVVDAGCGPAVDELADTLTIASSFLTAATRCLSIMLMRSPLWRRGRESESCLFVQAGLTF